MSIQGATVDAQASDVPASERLPDIEYVFDRLEISGNDKTNHLFFRSLLGFNVGEQVPVEALDRFRRELLHTGLFSSVQTRLSEGSHPEAVVVEVTVEERNTIRIDELFAGISADTPLWGGMQVSEANLFGSGLHLSSGFVVSQDQGAIGLSLADPFGALGIPLQWGLDMAFRDGVGSGPSVDSTGLPTETSFVYERFGGNASVGVTLADVIGVGLDFRLEDIELASFDDTEPTRVGIEPGDSLLSSVTLSFEVFSSALPFDSASGLRARVAVEGSNDWVGSDFEFIRLVGQVDADWWVAQNHLLRLGLLGGHVFTDGRAPFFDGFYIGDVSDWVAGRDMGLQFTDRRSVDLFGTGADLVTYGDLLTQLRAEWVIPFGGSDPTSRAEVFLGASLFGIRQGPWEVGRPQETVDSDGDGPVDGFRTDVAFDLGLRLDTPLGFLGVSVGSVLSLAPLN